MDQDFGNKIKAKRVEARMSRKELGELFGVAGTNVAKWESGSEPQHPELYQKVKDWLENGAKNYTMQTQPAAFNLRDPRDQELIDSIKKHNEDLKEIVLAQLTGLDKKLSGVGKSLDTAVALAFQQSLRTDAVGTTVLESLARLEKKKPDALIREADKKQSEKANRALRQGNSVDVHK